MRETFLRRHRWLTWTMSALVVVLVVVSASLAVVAHRIEPYLRARLIQGLQDRFHTRVELDTFHVGLGYGVHGLWGIWATGRGLRIWPPRHTGGDMPLEIGVQSIPLISLQEFRFHVPISYELRKSMRIGISELRIKGLDVNVPPRSERDKATGLESALTAPAGHGKGASNGAQLPEERVAGQTGSGSLATVVVERIDCEQTQLVLETDKPDKLPLGFAIEHLRLTHVAAGAPMDFEADLTNPMPKGVIHSAGSFGPWMTDDPGESPVKGTYRFEHADLASFKGIAGILSSTGHYDGTLRTIVVDGETDVPDFRLTHFGNAMRLHTRFHARVDGTNGDTWLQPVDATLGRSHFITQGKVVRVKSLTGSAGPLSASQTGHAGPFEGGHRIDLKVDVDRGKIDDFLRLASRSATPVLTGDIAVKVTLLILPGSEPVHQRIQLDGSFKLDGAHFTSEKVQKRIQELSLRGQGRPGELKNADANSISSQMQGSFNMANGVIYLPDLVYSVPGADIQLKGKYELDGVMHFDGTARMKATVSQMVGGWRGFLLKPADRFFKKDGAGAVVPIQIRGLHNDPQFGVDLGGMKKTSPQTPGQKQR
jgi:hypothetical protein